MSCLRIVYVDVLFLSNLAVNYLLLLLTARLSGVYTGRLRLLAGAALGAFFAVIMYFPALPAALAAPSKILLCAAITALAFGREPVRALPRIGLVFLGVSFAFAGGVLALQYLSGGLSASLSNGVPYFNISLKMLFCSSVAAYGLLRLVFGGGAMEINKKTVEIELFNSGKTVKLKGFTDTGNLLKDPLTGKSIIVISAHIGAELFGADACAVLRRLTEENTLESFSTLSVLTPGKFVLVPCKTAVGPSGMLLAARLDAISVNGRAEKKYLVGFSAQDIGMSDGCRAIISV